MAKKPAIRRPLPASDGDPNTVTEAATPLLGNNANAGASVSTAATESADLLPDPQTYTNLVRCRRPRSGRWMSLVDRLGVFIAASLFMLILTILWEVAIPTQKQRIYTCTLGISLIPVLIAAYTAVRPNKPLHNRVTPMALVIAIVCGSFPMWVPKAIGALGLFGLGWVSRPGMVVPQDHTEELNSKSSDDDLSDRSKAKEKREKILAASAQRAQRNLAKAAVCGMLLALALVTENFFIWAVSATFEPSWNPQTAPDPLQDNGRRVLLSLSSWLDFTKGDVISLRRVWNGQYALVASLGAALSVVDFHPTRQLWSLGCRALLTLISARILRTISFSLTVLPSQDKFCYIRRFPKPPPKEWWDWMMVGMIPMNNGGCNDLIVSGHATVTTTMACIAVSFADDNLFTFAVIWLLGMDYLVEVFEGFHYSVDMWMGAVLCSLLWRVLKPIEDNNTDRNAATMQDMLHRFQTDSITPRDAVVYGGPVLIVFLQVTFFPVFWTNFMILGFTSWCGIQMAIQGFQHYTRHLLFCLLYLGLGVYL